MYPGSYVVFEGPDLCGKSTISKLVAQQLQDEFGDGEVLLTAHPGATPLGRHLRKLTKFPEQFGTEQEHIIIDAFSTQLLMMVDQICFIRTILKPALSQGRTVLADRSNYISSLVYGLATGLRSTELNRLCTLEQCPAPDHVFIFRCPWEELRRRADARGLPPDRFEKGSLPRTVWELYNNLLTLDPQILVLLTQFVPVENVTYVDSTKQPEQLAKELAQQISKTISVK